jgi:hypothetical protein
MKLYEWHKSINTEKKSSTNAYIQIPTFQSCLWALQKPILAQLLHANDSNAIFVLIFFYLFASTERPK